MSANITTSFFGKFTLLQLFKFFLELEFFLLFHLQLKGSTKFLPWIAACNDNMILIVIKRFYSHFRVGTFMWTVLFHPHCNLKRRASYYHHLLNKEYKWLHPRTLTFVQGNRAIKWGNLILNSSSTCKSGWWMVYKRIY